MGLRQFDTVPLLAYYSSATATPHILSALSARLCNTTSASTTPTNGTMAIAIRRCRIRTRSFPSDFGLPSREREHVPVGESHWRRLTKNGECTLLAANRSSTPPSRSLLPRLVSLPRLLPPLYYTFSFWRLTSSINP